MIKSYWWEGAVGHGNFGDMLGPKIIEALSGQKVEHVSIERADILSIGSVLEPWFWPNETWQEFRGYVWGAGRMFGEAPMSLPLAEIRCIRGRRSQETLQLGSSHSLMLGDPGLLCPLLYHATTRPRHKLGIWPHWSEAKHPLFGSLLRRYQEISYIDPCGEVREVLAKALNCQAIATSSLHGMITADAFGIPSCWLRLNKGNEDDVGIPLFKYFDYFSTSQETPPQPYLLTESTTLDDLLATANCSRHNGVKALQAGLLSTFPYRKASPV